MILLFGEKANKTNSARRSSNIKNHPVENSGILANRGSAMPSLLDANEYDMYMFSVQAHIDYSQYADDTYSVADAGYSNEYSMAMNAMSDCASYGGESFGGESSFGGASFAGGGSFGGGSCSSCSGGFSSVG